MKTLRLFIFIFISLLFTFPVFLKAQWTQTTQVPIGIIYSVASNGTMMFAGVHNNFVTMTGGVYRSPDNGNTWTQTFTSPATVYSLYLYGSTLLAGTQDNIQRSTNNGTNWISGGVYMSVMSFTSSGSTVFAGASSYGVYRSTNGGVNWVQTSLNNRSVYSLTSSGSNIIAGTNMYGVYISTNTGTSWIQSSMTDATVYALTVSGNTVFAGTTAGVYRSDNNGSTWTQTTLNFGTVNTIAAVGSNVFAGMDYSGVYYSSNNGVSWVAKNQGFTPNMYVNSLHIANGYIWAGTDGASVWKRLYSEAIPVKNIGEVSEKTFRLFQNFPNPFNSETVIKFNLPVDGYAELKVFNAAGEEAAVLVNGDFKSGSHSVKFNAGNLPSGIYFYVLKFGSISKTEKMILMK